MITELNPSINIFTFIANAGRLGMIFGSLKYLKVESKITDFNAAVKPRTVRKNMIETGININNDTESFSFADRLSLNSR